MLVTITITEEMIRQGDRESSTRCPVAQGIARVTNVIPYIDLRLVYLYSLNPKQDVLIELPSMVRGKINLYDLTGEMQPFEFPLEIPNEFLRPEIKETYATDKALRSKEPRNRMGGSQERA